MQPFAASSRRNTAGEYNTARPCVGTTLKQMLPLGIDPAYAIDGIAPSGSERTYDVFCEPRWRYQARESSPRILSRQAPNGQGPTPSPPRSLNAGFRRFALLSWIKAIHAAAQ